MDSNKENEDCLPDNDPDLDKLDSESSSFDELLDIQGPHQIFEIFFKTPFRGNNNAATHQERY